MAEAGASLGLLISGQSKTVFQKLSEQPTEEWPPWLPHACAHVCTTPNMNTHAHTETNRQTDR